MRLTVIQKIIAGFVLFGGLLVITNVVSYLGLQQIEQSAQSVIEEKMPVQSQMQEVQTRILRLGQVSLQGYYIRDLAALGDNNTRFQDDAARLEQEIKKLEGLIGGSAAGQAAAMSAARQYVSDANQMYQLRERFLTLQNRLMEQFQAIDFAGADAGAYLLDMTYLPDAEEEPLRSVAGVGGKVDTLILTLTEATADYVKAMDAAESQSIRQNVEMALSDVDNNVQYMNNIAYGVDTDGLLETFNEEYQAFVELYQGEQGLFNAQEQKLNTKQRMDTAMSAAEAALADAQQKLDALFDEVNADTRQGQNAILDAVESNIVKGVVILVIAIALVGGIGTLVARSISTPLNQVRRSLRVISGGDLTHVAETDSDDEFASLARDVNALSNSLHEVVAQIIGQEVKLEQAVESSRQLADDTLNNVAEQTSQLRDTATNTEQVREASNTNLTQIHHSSECLAQGKHTMNSARNMVSRGREQILSQAEQAKESAEVIHRLEENTANISGILDVIRGIAEQTNLLALNAAIEAARAGEQGRGFAVVADEVRTLASRTQQSTEEINQMITSLQTDAKQAVNAINQGRSQADDSVHLIESVNEEIQTVQDMITELADINEQVVDKTGYQDQLLQAVADNLNRIVQLAEQSADSTERSSQSIQDVTGLMNELNQVVKRFKLRQ